MLAVSYVFFKVEKLLKQGHMAYDLLACTAEKLSIAKKGFTTKQFFYLLKIFKKAAATDKSRSYGFIRSFEYHS